MASITTVTFSPMIRTRTDPSSKTNWYADPDADGYGDLSKIVLACTRRQTPSHALDCDNTVDQS